MNITLIDVTLRDGGYITKFNFPKDELIRILQALDRTRVDMVEVGYRNGLPPGKSSLQLGASGVCARDYLMTCRALLEQSKLCVMVHPENVNLHDLVEMKECGVDLCRICVNRDNIDLSCEIAKQAKKIGLSVSMNITRVSRYSECDLDEVFDRLNAKELADVIYFADSNGSLKTKAVHLLYSKYSKRARLPLGFHAHDNLGLAQANTLAAMDAGATFVDASVAGLGKGIGNLNLELFIAYLQSIGHHAYQLDNLVDIAKNIKSQHGAKGFSYDGLLMGIHDLSLDDIKNNLKVVA